MRGKIAGLPRGARLLLGLFTVVVFAFFGMTMKESSPVVGWALIGLAGLRLFVWLGEARRLLAAPPDDDE